MGTVVVNQLKTSPMKPDIEKSPGCVLIVDDTQIIRTLLETLLVNNNFQVLTASCGSDAIDIFRDHSEDISIVLLDIRMPDMDGPTTLKRLQTIDPHVQCCFMSGDPGRYNPEELLTMGASHYFPKPLPLNELLETLQDLTQSQE